jgi:hypothetical protein
MAPSSFSEANELSFIAVSPCVFLESVEDGDAAVNASAS